MSTPNRRLDTPAIKALEDELRAENEQTLRAAHAFQRSCDSADRAHEKPSSKRYRIRNIRKQLERPTDAELSENTPENGTELRKKNGTH